MLEAIRLHAPGMITRKVIRTHTVSVSVDQLYGADLTVRKPNLGMVHEMLSGKLLGHLLSPLGICLCVFALP